MATAYLTSLLIFLYSPIVSAIGNILLQRGRVVARNLTSKELEERLKKLLP
ncbi:MAG: hypothetical protein IJM81_03695 [Prevotella sp.]|nr:hypothetical protein [Prevotella sp.]